MEEYLNEDYIKLFKNMNNEELKLLKEVKNNDGYQMLKETPDNSIYNNKSINETPVNRFKIQENVNDGWNMDDFSIETRINGQIQRNNENPYQQSRRNRLKNDPNGLGQYMDDDDDLREVFRHKTQQIRQNQQQNSTPVENLQITGSFSNVDVVSMDLFEGINHRVLEPIAVRYFNS